MDENRKLIHTYEIFKKDFGKNIPCWKVPEGIKCGFDKVNSLEDVSNYLSTSYPEKSWKLIEEKVINKGTIYTFKDIPSAGSDAERNPEQYFDHFIKIKIKSKVSLENKLEGDKK